MTETQQLLNRMAERLGLPQRPADADETEQLLRIAMTLCDRYCELAEQYQCERAVWLEQAWLAAGKRAALHSNCRPV